jgi:hypothetical protein
MPNSISALRLKQWLPEWDSYEFDEQAQRRKPSEYIFLFSMSALELRQLSDVYRRQRQTNEVEGIQRARDENRTGRIQRYVKTGYPYGDLKPNLQTLENLHLRKPGWLPTAIVVNLLTPDDRPRRGRTIEADQAASFSDNGNGTFMLNLPDLDAFDTGDLRPFEIIDGQHRLWAFEEGAGLPDDFELPVVAFVGLDVAWQAYLFWSINVSPKRINPSHAFDLYPLLRTQDWLEQTGEISVYREARAQELVEWLYRHPQSPWSGRINMLGQKGEGRVSQAAWVRSLLGSFLGTGRGKGRHGLFQAAISEQEPLGWSRSQQVAFLIAVWAELLGAIESGHEEWINHYRNEEKNPVEDKSNMLNQDMGVRAVNAAINDVFLAAAKTAAEQGDPWSWDFEPADDTETTAVDIDGALNSLRGNRVFELIQAATSALASFDWRSLDGPDVKGSDIELEKRAFRGSGGYTVLVSYILNHLRQSNNAELAELAQAASVGGN